MRNRKIYTIAALFLIFIVLIFVRDRNGNYYTLTPEEVHQLTLNNNMYIQPENINSDDNFLIINILDIDESESPQSENYLQINLADLIQPGVRKKIKKHSGTILLKSNNEILLTNAWYVLSRKGIENIKMIEKQKEELLYEFQPDSSAGLK